MVVNEEYTIATGHTAIESMDTMHGLSGLCICQICTCGQHRCPHTESRMVDHVSSELQHFSESEQELEQFTSTITESEERFIEYQLQQTDRAKMKRDQTALMLEGETGLGSSYREEFYEKEFEQQKKFKNGFEDTGEGDIFHSRRMVRERSSSGQPENADWSVHLHEVHIALDSGSGGQHQQQLQQSASTQSTEEYSSSKSFSTQQQEQSFQIQMGMEARSSSASHFKSQQQQQESLITTSEQILRDRSASRERASSILSDEVTRSILHEASTLPSLNTQSPVTSTCTTIRKQLRGGKLVDIPIQTEEKAVSRQATRRLVDDYDFSASAAQSEFSSLLKEASHVQYGQDIEQSETIIRESSRLLKELGEQKETLSQLNTEYSAKSGTTQAELLKKESRSRFDDFETKSSSKMEADSSGELISYRPGTPVHTNTKDQRQIRGSSVETRSCDTYQDFQTVQGLTVTSQTKPSLERTHDQRKAHADLEEILRTQTLYDVDIESSLLDSKVKAGHEREVSSGIETAEKILRTITEIKSSQASNDNIEIDEKIHASTARKMKEEDESYKAMPVFEKCENRNFLAGPREPIARRQDQLKLEGAVDYESTSRKDFDEKQHDKVKAVRRNTYTKQEGEMYLQTTSRDEFTGLKGERVDVKRHGDNLQMTGPFYGREKQPTPKIERAKPIIRKGNLKPFEGAFTARRIEDAPRLQRVAVKIPKENLRLEGQHYYPAKPTAPACGERHPVVRHPDNITFQEDFPQRYFEPAPKIARTPPITQQDNLKPFEGAFTERRVEDAPKFERAVVKIPKENLRSEGQYYYPAKLTAPTHGERYPVVHHPDNIMLKGDFPQRHVEPAPKWVATKPITHGDNLRPEGQHYYPERPIAPAHGERYPIVRHPDNIMLKGDFPQRQLQPSPKMERAKPITHGDNLKPEGQHYYPQRPTTPTCGERYPVVHHPDNLALEGHFPKRHMEPAPKMEKTRPITPRADNLRPEGQHYYPDRPITPTRGERYPIVRHPDNITLSGGQHYYPEKPKALAHGERYPVVHHPDNLVPGGEFAERPVENGPKIGERFPIKKHEDNLALEGEFAKRVVEVYKAGDRYPIVKPKDNLVPGGQFYVPPQQPTPKIDRAQPITQEDNLKPSEGVFPTRSIDEVPKGERASVKVPQENLKPEGQHYYPEKPAAPIMGDRFPVKRPLDNLALEGEFFGRPKEEAPKVGERHPVKKPKDNLKPFEGPTPQRAVEEVGQGERAERVVHEDSIRLEGAHSFGKKAEAFVVGERPKRVVHEDNLAMMEGKFSDMTTAKENYKEYTAEKANVVRHEDNLKMEGEFHGRKEETVAMNGERAVVKKAEDNLKMEGELDILEKTNTVMKGERAAIVKHEDNLTVGEGSMLMETTSRSDQRAALLSAIESRSKQASTQMSSQIVLGDEAGDARFGRTATARRTTVETRNLPNGHMLQEKVIESSTEHKAETKTSADRSVEQKVLTQSIGAKTGINESILLNASGAQEQSLKAVPDESTFEGSLRSDLTQQIQGNKTGTREVNVTREVTVTKRSGEGDDSHAAIGSSSMRALEQQQQSGYGYGYRSEMSEQSSFQRMASSSSAKQSSMRQASSRSHQEMEMGSSLLSSSSKAMTMANGSSESRAIERILDKSSEFSTAIQQQKSSSTSTSMAESRKMVSGSSTSREWESKSGGGGGDSYQLRSTTLDSAHAQKSSGIAEASSSTAVHGISSSSYQTLTGGSSSAASGRIVATISQKASGTGFIENQTSSASSGFRQEFLESKPCPALLLESGKSSFHLEGQTSSHKFYTANASD